MNRGAKLYIVKRPDGTTNVFEPGTSYGKDPVLVKYVGRNFAIVKWPSHSYWSGSGKDTNPTTYYLLRVDGKTSREGRRIVDTGGRSFKCHSFLLVLEKLDESQPGNHWRRHLDAIEKRAQQKVDENEHQTWLEIQEEDAAAERQENRQREEEAEARRQLARAHEADLAERILAVAKNHAFAGPVGAWVTALRKHGYSKPDVKKIIADAAAALVDDSAW